jgi:hypothetical protein
MSPKIIGRCVICAQELKAERELLVCPSGHYKVNARAWESRWQEYLQEQKESGPVEADKTRLLSDLRRLNQVEL